MFKEVCPTVGTLVASARGQESPSPAASAAVGRWQGRMHGCRPGTHTLLNSAYGKGEGQMSKQPSFTDRVRSLSVPCQEENPNVSLVTRLIFNYLIIQNHFGVDKYF